MSFCWEKFSSIQVKFKAFKLGLSETFVGALAAVTNMLGLYELAAWFTTRGTDKKELRKVFIVGKVAGGKFKAVSVVENESGLFEVPDEFTAFQIFAPTPDVNAFDFMFQEER